MTRTMPINPRPAIKLAVLPGTAAAQSSAAIATEAAHSAKADAQAIGLSLSAPFVMQDAPELMANARVLGDTATVAFDWSVPNAVAANVPDGAVTYAKIQNVGANRLVGSIAGGAAEEIALTAAGRALIDDADTAAQRATLGLVIGTNVQAQDAELSALAGLTSAADRVPYFTGAGTAALATLTAFGRSIAALVDLPALKTLIGNFSSLLSGLVPASGGGTTNFLRADGSWAVPPGGGMGGPPLVILYWGQSNTGLHYPFTWPEIPAANFAGVWDWDGSPVATYGGAGDDDGDTGSEFIALDGTRIAWPYADANEEAKLNPGRTVYALVFGGNAYPIEDWMVGASAPNMYAATKSNVEAALTLLGVDKIDKMKIWDGESNFVPSMTANFKTNFETVFERFYGETWCPRSTPITMMGFSHYYINTALGRATEMIRQIADVDPCNRIFVPTAEVLPDTTLHWGDYYAATNKIHMTPLGYWLAGKISARMGSGHGQRPGLRVLNSAQGLTVTNLATPVVDPSLSFIGKAGKTYVVECYIEGLTTSAAADIKWSLISPAPSSGIYGWRYDYIDAAAATTVISQYGVTAPVNKTILVGASPNYFVLKITATFRDLAATGEIAFAISQNTATASHSAQIFPGSRMTYTEQKA